VVKNVVSNFVACVLGMVFFVISVKVSNIAMFTKFKGFNAYIFVSLPRM